MDPTPPKNLRSDDNIDCLVAMESIIMLLSVVTVLMLLHVHFEISNLKPHVVMEITCNYEMYRWYPHGI
jgi:hypothetical protein